MCCNSICSGQKLIKRSKCKFNLCFIVKIINIDNRSCRKLCFSFPLQPTFSLWQLTKDLVLPAQAKKQSAHTKTWFSFKTKDQIILFELADMLKNIVV